MKILRTSLTTYCIIVYSQDNCGSELHHDPQSRCNGESQKYDSLGDDAGHVQPSLLRFSVWLGHCPPQ